MKMPVLISRKGSSWDLHHDLVIVGGRSDLWRSSGFNPDGDQNTAQSTQLASGAYSFSKTQQLSPIDRRAVAGLLMRRRGNLTARRPLHQEESRHTGLFFLRFCGRREFCRLCRARGASISSDSRSEKG